MSATAPAGDFPPYQWYCPACCRWHRGSCSSGGPVPYQLVYNVPGAAAGHCGKCGAPYTQDFNHMDTSPRFVASCKCWNV